MRTELKSTEMGAWLLVAAAVGLLAISAGSRSVFGLFISPLNSATGLGIATISLAVAVGQFTLGAAQPLCGMLAERYGTARIIAAGSLLAAVTSALLPVADTALLLVVLFAAGGVAVTAASPSLLIGTVSQRVAPERRGLVAGLIGAGGPLGQLVLAPATQAAISVAGWITTVLSLAGLALVSLPLALTFRRRPGTGAVASSSAQPSTHLRDVLASRDFWLINFAFFVCGVHVFFLVTHLPGVIELCGQPASLSGFALALLGLFNIVGSIAAGFATQRWSMKRTLAVLFIARALGIAAFLAAPKTEFAIFAFATWMGLTYMAVLPPISGLISKLYGAQRLPTLLGLVFLLHQIGAFLGAWLGGLVLEGTGSYDRVWVLDLIIATFAACASLCVREYPMSRRHGDELPSALGATPASQIVR